MIKRKTIRQFLKFAVVGFVATIINIGLLYLSTEFLVKSIKKGFKISEIPVTHYPRIKGEATWANIRVILCKF